MLREFDVGILPVIDDLAARKLMGVVTDRDLCLAALVELHDPSLTTVEDCMATDLVTCTPQTDIRDVLADAELAPAPFPPSSGSLSVQVVKSSRWEAPKAERRLGLE